MKYRVGNIMRIKLPKTSKLFERKTGIRGWKQYHDTLNNKLCKIAYRQVGDFDYVIILVDLRQNSIYQEIGIKSAWLIPATKEEKKIYKQIEIEKEI
jgi:hypothetical protein